MYSKMPTDFFFQALDGQLLYISSATNSVYLDPRHSLDHLESQFLSLNKKKTEYTKYIMCGSRGGGQVVRTPLILDIR